MHYFFCLILSIPVEKMELLKKGSIGVRGMNHFLIASIVDCAEIKDEQEIVESRSHERIILMKY